MEKTETRRQRDFCRAYLRTMDPERAAGVCGCGDGFALLDTKAVRERLEKMRETAAGQICREDVLRRLAQLAFGGANDAARLALRWGEADPETLDLSAVAELKVTDKGGLEIKLVDRVRALETLYGLLENDGGGAAELYRALTEAAGGDEGSWDHG
ncbi:terminase small subunit [Dysosmobacter sp.]|uniref:terminase small subunit n=1 Tax=Dysosmobacter sp. TaxID=2591382 RepID=UPI002A8FD235|nr:terminase small subunit [Dysosmobacter sp.]MDY3985121.1 terminase small subunit [Dysosmobacter sp.]